MLFGSWHGLLRVVIISVCAYVGLLVLLRVSGKRTLSKMNAFDFVVTVALGSTLATAILSKETPLAQALLAFAMLIFLQFLVTYLSVRLPWVDRLVKAEPRLLYYRGQFLDQAMRAERVTRTEVLQAMREGNTSALENVEAVVLETAGTISIVQKTAKAASALEDVGGFPESDEP